LKDKNALSIRCDVANAIGYVGPAARDAIPALIIALEPPPEAGPAQATVIREGAIYALGRMGPDAKVAVPALAKVIQDARLSAELRFCAIRSLGNLGPPAKDAVPSLIQFLKEKKNRSYFHEATLTLAGIGCDAVPAL